MTNLIEPDKSIVTTTEDKMKIGTLCRVIKFKTHRPCQYNDVVVITGIVGTGSRADLLLGTNLKTSKDHHYWCKDLEVINESR